MTNALFIGWGRAIPGREQKAVQVFGEAVEYWMRLQQQGEIESFQTYQLEAHGGDLQGFLVARADPEKLSGLRASEEFNRLNVRAALVVENFGVVNATTGQELEQLFGHFAASAAELA